ncbi:amidohydrolase family protein [Allopusillimonas soli]|uniref:Amidohydrolase n=1 Tax=Allopusillimonas soli TaxID=659016 RepID=A0A853F5G9_9BURK|nr:amidohydrolase family protein [Allopusillimonas soli]NYT35353.1 amidohydrolase [Allopusillimonas soli]
MLITDSQVHLWEAHRPDRPWPTEEVGQPVFVAEEGARPHRKEPLQADELLHVMRLAGVHRAIIVPPSPVGDENLTAMEAAARYPKQLAVMGRFNPQAANARERITRWLSQKNMLGIRMTFHKEKWKEWLEGDTLDWFWEKCERLRIPLMLLAPGLLHKIEHIAIKHPDLIIILDHMARQSSLRDDACFADIEKLITLSRYPNVSVKVSAVPCYTTQPYPFSNLKPFLRQIYDAFGPRKLMWGSDYTRLPCTYQECLDHFRYALDFLGDEDKDWILGGTIAELLRWPEAEFP